MLDEEERARLPTIINLHMFYRIDRIKELLQQKEKFSLEDMKKMVSFFFFFFFCFVSLSFQHLLSFQISK